MVANTAIPLFTANSRITSITCVAAALSRPEVGSSKNKIAILKQTINVLLFVSRSNLERTRFFKQLQTYGNTTLLTARNTTPKSQILDLV